MFGEHRCVDEQQLASTIVTPPLKTTKKRLRNTALYAGPYCNCEMSVHQSPLEMD